jgi:hypothetical protein
MDNIRVRLPRASTLAYKELRRANEPQQDPLATANATHEDSTHSILAALKAAQSAPSSTVLNSVFGAGEAPETLE